MPRKLSIVFCSLLAAASAIVWAGSARTQAAEIGIDLRVTDLHVAVNAGPGSPRAIVFRGMITGYQHEASAQIQNVACLFAARPGVPLPKEYDEAQVRVAVGNIQPDGEFYVSAPLCLLRRESRDWTALNVRFVGPVGLGETSETIYHAPVLGEDDVDLGDVPALSDGIQVVNSGPSVLDANYDPLLTVRACNALIRMGKERASLTMRAYTDIAALPYPWDQLPCRPESLDASDQRRVILLLHLVGEAREHAQDLSRAASHEPTFIDLGNQERVSFNPAQGWHATWSLGMVCPWPSDATRYPGLDYPFVIEGDVPFYLPELLGGRTGYDSSPGPYLTLFERYGAFRQRGVYRPKGTLAEILDGVIRRIPSRKQELCDQALALLPLDLGGVPDGARSCLERRRAQDCVPAHLAAGDCDALLDWLHRTPLVWDEKAEAFVKK